MKLEFSSIFHKPQRLAGTAPFIDPRPFWKIWFESSTGTDEPQIAASSLEAFTALHKFVIDPEANLESRILKSKENRKYILNGYIGNLFESSHQFGSVPIIRGAFLVEYLVPPLPFEALQPEKPLGLDRLNDEDFIWPITSFTTAYLESQKAIEIYGPEQRLVCDYMYQDFYELAQQALVDPSFSYLESYRAKQKS